MSDADVKFYFRFSLIILAAGFIWFFNSGAEQEKIADDGGGHWAKSPAVLGDFVPPVVAVLNDAENLLPKRNWSVPALELEAEAAIAVRADGGRVYFNKNTEVRRPVASLTKIMTAIVAVENYDLSQIIKISAETVRRDGSQGDLRVGEEITVRALLNIMLVGSSNDAAAALAEGKSEFIALMNKKAEAIGLSNTRFANPDGLDEDGHYGTARDMAQILVYFMNNHPQEFKIMEAENVVVYSADGKTEHRLKNTNELLGAISEVKAGKTGYTDKAGGSLILLISGLSFGDGDNIITVVLGSPDRFGESEKLIDWLRAAYIWEK